MIERTTRIQVVRGVRERDRTVPYFACSLRTRRARSLGPKPCGDLETCYLAGISARGTRVTYGRMFNGIYPIDGQVFSRDLLTGSIRMRRGWRGQPARGEGDGRIIRTASWGADFAWSTYNPYPSPEDPFPHATRGPLYQIRTAGNTYDGITLASSPGVDPHSLRLSHRVVSWIENGVRRYHALP